MITSKAPALRFWKRVWASLTQYNRCLIPASIQLTIPFAAFAGSRTIKIGSPVLSHLENVSVIKKMDDNRIYNKRQLKSHQELLVPDPKRFKLPKKCPRKTKQEINNSEGSSLDQPMQSIKLEEKVNPKEHYDKKPKVVAFCNGITYQLQLSMLILILAARAIKKTSKLDFKLSCEDKNGIEFDDIGFCFKKDNEPWTSLFIQAKFTSDVRKTITLHGLTLSKDSNFLICKYFSSIFKYRNKTGNDGTQDRVMFVLCTNYVLHKEVAQYTNKVCFNKKEGHDHTILETYFNELSAIVSKFKYAIGQKPQKPREIHDVLEKEYTDLSTEYETACNTETTDSKLQRKQECMAKFFNSFMIATESISGDDILKKVKTLIKDSPLEGLPFEYSGNRANELVIKLEKWLNDWIKDKVGIYLTSEDLYIFIIHHELRQTSLATEKDIKVQSDKIRPKSWTEYKLYKNLFDYHSKKCVSSIKPIKITCSDSNSIALGVISKFNSMNEVEYLFLEGKYFMSLRSEIMKLFYGYDHSLIIAVDFTQNSAHIPNDLEIDDKPRNSLKILIVIEPKLNETVTE